jgi:hypothetical protein
MSLPPLFFDFSGEILIVLYTHVTIEYKGGEKMKKCEACGKLINEGYMIMLFDCDDIYEVYLCDNVNCTKKAFEYGSCNVAIFKGDDPPFVIGHIGEKGIEDENTFIFMH